MAEQDTLQGTVEHVVYHSPDTGYTVIEVSAADELVTAVGALGDVNEGEEITLHGGYVTHASFGRQFKADYCEVTLPATVGAVRKYLASGALPHIGPAIAARIVDMFGAQTLEVIATQPQQLAKVKGLSADKAEAVANEFRRTFGLREAMVHFAAWGIPAAKAAEMFRHYGPNVIDIINGNPYLLCSFPTYVPFAAVDRIAGDMLLDFESKERVGAGIFFVLRHNLNNGHACLPYAPLIRSVSDFISVEPDHVESILNTLIEEDELCLTESENVYLPDLYKAEQSIAYYFCTLMKIPCEEAKNTDTLIQRAECINGIAYAPLQRKAIEAVLQHNAVVLTGGPGTGKTTTINGIIFCCEQQGLRVALAAPTGRAAKRMSELTGKKATTIHRLLEVDYAADDTVRFIHNEKNHLKCDMLVIDEMSMVDAKLMESLLLALKMSCKIVMVGDENQLPSVGAGNVLAGIIASGTVPVVSLTDVFRQAAQSLIVANAHRIIAGEPMQKGGKTDDFFILETPVTKAQQLVAGLVCARLPASYGYNAMQDIQVICPSKMGPLGTEELNKLLQAQLNPPMPHKAQLTLGERILRTGDKVMQIKNNYDIPFVRPEGGEDGAGAFNGDMGVIESVSTQSASVTVRMEDKVYVYTADALRELQIAYAITVHKSQGSEFEAVIIPVLDTPPKLRYQNLIYTGITRAKALCILVGSGAEAQQMAANTRRNKRFSCLAEFMRGEGAQ